MDESIENVIEKIKLQEQNNDTRLKEKREFESKLAFMKRNVRDATTQISKLNQEISELVNTTNKLKVEVDKVQVQRDALTQLLCASETNLKKLRIETDKGISAVWDLRSSLCDSIKKIVDKCDVRTALMNNIKTDVVHPRTTKSTNICNFTINTKKLELATEKLNKTIKERDYLLKEPEIGDDYIRIKNALKYSEAKINSLESEINNL